MTTCRSTSTSTSTRTRPPTQPAKPPLMVPWGCPLRTPSAVIQGATSSAPAPTSAAALVSVAAAPAHPAAPAAIYYDRYLYGYYCQFSIALEWSEVALDRCPVGHAGDITLRARCTPSLRKSSLVTRKSITEHRQMSGRQVAWFCLETNDYGGFIGLLSSEPASHNVLASGE